MPIFPPFLRKPIILESTSPFSVSDIIIIIIIIIIRLLEKIIYVAEVKPVIRSYVSSDQFAYREGTNTTTLAPIKSQHMWLKWLDTGEADCVRVLPLISLRPSNQFITLFHLTSLGKCPSIPTLLTGLLISYLVGNKEK